MASAESALDTRIDIVTPENIAFRHRLAGPFQRLPAYLIDSLIRVLALGMLLIALTVVSVSVGLADLGIGAWLVAWFLLDWFYGGVFEAMWNGQTPGKRSMRLRVVTVEGQPIRAWQAVLRNFLRAADAMPVFLIDLFPTFLLGLASSSSNGRYQRLGDLACGTMVIVEEQVLAHGVKRITDPEVIELAGRLPPGMRVTRSLGRALAMYVSRRQRFGWRRRAEIAMHVVGPLREKFDLPDGVPADTLLCALYYRAFITDVPDVEARTPPRELPPIRFDQELPPAKNVPEFPIKLS